MDLTALSNAPAITEYTTVRKLNYFFENFKNAKGQASENNKYLGEARFFRAYLYFNMLKKFGGVTWVNTVLPGEKELMEVPKRFQNADCGFCIGRPGSGGCLITSGRQ